MVNANAVLEQRCQREILPHLVDKEPLNEGEIGAADVDAVLVNLERLRQLPSCLPAVSTRTITVPRRWRICAVAAASFPGEVETVRPRQPQRSPLPNVQRLWHVDGVPRRVLGNEPHTEVTALLALLRVER